MRSYEFTLTETFCLSDDAERKSFIEGKINEYLKEKIMEYDEPQA